MFFAVSRIIIILPNYRPRLKNTCVRQVAPPEDGQSCDLCIYVYICIVIYIYIYTHMHTYVCIYLSTYICIYLSTDPHIHIHIYLPPKKAGRPSYFWLPRGIPPGTKIMRRQMCDFREHATSSAPAELGAEIHKVSRNRARTQVLLQARKLHVRGSGTCGASWKKRAASQDCPDSEGGRATRGRGAARPATLKTSSTSRADDMFVCRVCGYLLSLLCFFVKQTRPHIF